MGKLWHSLRDAAAVMAIVLLTMISAELAFRLITYFRVYFHRAQKEEALSFKDLYVAFDGKYSIDELREMRVEVTDKLEYEPWVQFGNFDHSQKYSRSSNGLRESYRDPNCDKKNRKLTVWFFGGSTMYGVGVPWWDTITSQFVKQRENEDVCYVAVNYGVPYYFARQELVRFSSELLAGNRPDIAVFLDGLNDFAQPGATIRGEPFFTPVLRHAIPRGGTLEAASPTSPNPFVILAKSSHLVRYLAAKLTKHNHSDGKESAPYNNYDIPAGASPEPTDVAGMIVKNYLLVRNQLAVLCDGYNVRCIQYLQPVAVKDYLPPAGENLTSGFRKKDESRLRRFLIGYGALGAALGNNSSLIAKKLWWKDISGIFADYQGIPYVDGGHYSPRAISKIASTMHNDILLIKQ